MAFVPTLREQRRNTISQNLERMAHSGHDGAEQFARAYYALEDAMMMVRDAHDEGVPVHEAEATIKKAMGELVQAGQLDDDDI